jgi:hypothetical protein
MLLSRPPQCERLAEHLSADELEAAEKAWQDAQLDPLLSGWPGEKAGVPVHA